MAAGERTRVLAAEGPEHRPLGPRVPLGDHEHPQARAAHRSRLTVASVRCASWDGRYSRPARNCAPPRSPRHGCRRRPPALLVADRQGVDHPSRQPCSRARAPQWLSRPQPKRRSGNGISSCATARRNTCQWPDLHVLRAPGERPRPPAGDAPGGVAATGLGRLGQVQRQPLAHREHAVEEARRQVDVVVGDHDPVVVCHRDRGRQQPVEVLELAAGHVPGHGLSGQRRVGRRPWSPARSARRGGPTAAAPIASGRREPGR